MPIWLHVYDHNGMFEHVYMPFHLQLLNAPVQLSTIAHDAHYVFMLLRLHTCTWERASRTYAKRFTPICCEIRKRVRCVRTFISRSRAPRRYTIIVSFRSIFREPIRRRRRRRRRQPGVYA